MYANAAAGAVKSGIAAALGLSKSPFLEYGACMLPYQTQANKCKPVQCKPCWRVCCFVARALTAACVAPSRTAPAAAQLE